MSEKIRINPEMRNWVDRYLPAIPKLSGDAICEFEAVVNPKEGTSFDFIAYDCNTEIRFEIKFTEEGFGKTKKTVNQNREFPIIKSIQIYINRG